MALFSGWSKTASNATRIGPQGQKVVAWRAVLSEGSRLALQGCCEWFACLRSGGDCFGVAASLPAQVDGGFTVALKSPSAPAGAPSGLTTETERVSILESFS